MVMWMQQLAPTGIHGTSEFDMKVLEIYRCTAVTDHPMHRCILETTTQLSSLCPPPDAAIHQQDNQATQHIG
jgi:hypothetical protein